MQSLDNCSGPDGGGRDKSWQSRRSLGGGLRKKTRQIKYCKPAKETTSHSDVLYSKEDLLQTVVIRRRPQPPRQQVMRSKFCRSRHCLWTTRRSLKPTKRRVHLAPRSWMNTCWISCTICKVWCVFYSPPRRSANTFSTALGFGYLVCRPTKNRNYRMSTRPLV